MGTRKLWIRSENCSVVVFITIWGISAGISESYLLINLQAIYETKKSFFFLFYFLQNDLNDFDFSYFYGLLLIYKNYWH